MARSSSDELAEEFSSETGVELSIQTYEKRLREETTAFVH